MNKRIWTIEELSYLRSNYKIQRVEEICVRLSRTRYSVQRQASYLGLHSDHGHTQNDWTQAEDDLLRSIYATASKPEMREIFKRTDAGIYHRANRLGLEKTKYDAPKRPYMHEWVYKMCLHCEQEFRLKKYQLTEHKESPRDYCSQRCFYLSRRTSGLEDTMREELKSEGFQFEEQYKVGKWHIDFALIHTVPKIAIQCDGDYWHGHPSYWRNGEPNFVQKKNMQNDIKQAKYIAKLDDWLLLRFWGREIETDIDSCLSKIRASISS